MTGTARDGYANGMPATELRTGDVFYIEGEHSVPGVCTVTGDPVVAALDDQRDYVLAVVAIPAGHRFGYVANVDHPDHVYGGPYRPAVHVKAVIPDKPRCICTAQGGAVYSSGCPVHDPR